MIEVDMDGVPMETFTLLEKGDYLFQVVEAEEKTSSKGNPMAEITFEEDKTGKKIKDYFVFNDNEICLSKIKRFLSFIGQPFDGKLKINVKDWIGERVMGNVYIDTYTKDNGEESKSNKIRYYSAYKAKGQANAGASMADDIRGRSAVNAEETTEEIPF